MVKNKTPQYFVDFYGIYAQKASLRRATEVL